MLKLFSTFLSSLVFLIMSVFFESEPAVYVTADSPVHVVSGNEFIVHMTIHKGQTLGFARIQQFLPAGFQAEEIESANAQFIADSSSIKFIWTQMPSEESFEISYKVKTNQNLNGLQVINGVLIYIEDEKTEQYALPPIEVRISDDVSTSNDDNIPQVERKLIATVPELNEYRVELKIQPKSEVRPARFIDQIPEGYEAFAGTSHGAHFLFSEGLVTFTWTNLPKDSAFTISYTVRSSQRRTPPAINGMLVYGNAAMAMELDSLDAKDELFEQALKTTDESADKILEELIASENAKQENSGMGTQTAGTALNIPSAKGGISYQVQIAATMKSPARNNNWFKKYYKVDEEVSLTYHEGWKKYLIGTFDNFKSANLYKRKTREKVSDAFVVAYQDGQRISLKEASAAKATNQ